MTVAELIRQLQALGIENQDLPVVRADADWGFVKLRNGAQVEICEAGSQEDTYGWTTESPTEEYVFKAVRLS